MSKLIDVDELVKALDKSLDEACKDKTDIKDILVRQLLVGFAKQVLSAAPTVEAISIEQIKKWDADKNKDFYDCCKTLTDDNFNKNDVKRIIYKDLPPYNTIQALVEDWEKENAAD